MSNVKVTAPYLGDEFCQAMGDAKAMVEVHIYNFCSLNVEKYVGGCWENVITEEGFVYRRLVTSIEKMVVHNKGAFWKAEVTPDAMGLIATLIALNFTLWDVYQHNEKLGLQLEKQFYQLRDWAFTNHPESADICMALD